MVHWLMTTIHGLRTRVDKYEDSGGYNNGLFLVSAITVVCIADNTKCLDHLSEGGCVDIVELLRHSYQTNPHERCSCPAYETLVKHLPTVQYW